MILPMLVLHSSFQRDNSAAQQYVRNEVPRLHFLSALFEEAYKYLQNYLSASILGIKIYTIPFCRDVTLDLKSVATMKCAIDDCRMGGGALVVAPEHRLSLELIVASPLYMRTFGDINFEVVEKGDFLETRYPIFGRFYRFSKGSSLTIYEFREDESEMLELLDGTPDGVSWAMDLPIRLKSMHSHWLL